jgi:hypothetical protein
MPAKPPSERRPGLPAVVDYIVARALKKKPAERYATATELAADLRKCLPEVREAEATMRARASSGDTAPHDASTLPAAEDRMELRASRRFDSKEALARLSVLSHDEDSRSRGGWTVQVERPRRRLERSTVILAATYGIAVLLAVAIVVL